MKMKMDELKSIVKDVMHEVTQFKDVSSLAFDAKLYDAIGNLHESLYKQLGDLSEANNWLRNLVQDAVESQIDDFRDSL